MYVCACVYAHVRARAVSLSDRRQVGRIEGWRSAHLDAQGRLMFMGSADF